MYIKDALISILNLTDNNIVTVPFHFVSNIFCGSVVNQLMSFYMCFGWFKKLFVNERNL